MIIVEDINDNILNSVQLDNLKIPYGPDMFRAAIDTIAKHDVAVAVDGAGQPLALLKYQPGTYTHHYRYAGGVDMWFLNQYDCIFLHECNEYSVELCRSVFEVWQGKRLILVGRSWERMIPLLPDLPEIACFYEEELTAERTLELIGEDSYLQVIYGIPCSESIDRYKQGIVYYDEVMSFTFMFSDCRELGDRNPDKFFFVIDGHFSNLGLFALFPKVETCARYVKSIGFIPVVRITMSDSSFYSNFQGDDIWAKFYNQPEQFTMDEVMESKNVFFSPGFYNGSVQTYIMNQQCSSTLLSWQDGKYNRRVCDYINNRKGQFLPYPKRTLGVLARGTDYVNTHLSNHPIHASIDMLCHEIDTSLEKWNLDYIYVSTEDESYCRYLKNRYGNKVTFTDQERYSVKDGEMLSQMHARQKEKRDGFLLGAEYILSIHLLSQCNSLIASGWCGGVSEALMENDGEYENVFVFDLGVNK